MVIIRIIEVAKVLITQWTEITHFNTIVGAYDWYLRRNRWDFIDSHSILVSRNENYNYLSLNLVFRLIHIRGFESFASSMILYPIHEEYGMAECIRTDDDMQVLQINYCCFDLEIGLGQNQQKGLKILS